MTTEIKIGVCIAALLIAFFLGYHQGGLSIRLKDSQAVIQQTTRNEAQGQQDAKTIIQEAKTHADAISADPMPTPAVICVRQYASPGPLLPATAPGRSGHGQASLSTADYRPVPSFAGGVDIGKPAAKIGQACDAQVIEAQDYIRDVCRPKP